MTILPAPVSELDLHAWADGALSAERAARVADWLRAHPAAAEEVRHWRLQAEALRQLYPLPGPETMSPALRRSLARVAAPLRPAAALSGWPGWRLAGLAAALALALSVGAAALISAKGPAGSLADRASRLQQGFPRATAQPASLAGGGSAGRT